MTIVRMTKTQIVNAIKRESLLQNGHWVTGINVNATIKSARVDKSCTMCAVGAVMRRAIDSSNSLDKLWDVAEHEGQKGCYSPGYYDSETTLFKNAKYDTDRGFYMSALSYVFEACVDGDTGSVVERRRRAIRFVETYFPESIDLDIDGAKPARDVKVMLP